MLRQAEALAGARYGEAVTTATANVAAPTGLGKLRPDAVNAG